MKNWSLLECTANTIDSTGVYSFICHLEALDWRILAPNPSQSLSSISCLHTTGAIDINTVPNARIRWFCRASNIHAARLFRWPKPLAPAWSVQRSASQETQESNKARLWEGMCSDFYWNFNIWEVWNVLWCYLVCQHTNRHRQHNKDRATDGREWMDK